MRVLSAQRYRVSKRVLAEVSAVLMAGGVVAFPTESSYGLAVDPCNEKAVRKVFAIKKRSSAKSLPLVASAIADVRKVFELQGVAGRLARRWPAPLTMVLRVKKDSRKIFAKGVAGADGSVAVRVPKSVWARAVAGAGGGMVTSTSANISGDAAIFDAGEIVRAFGRARVRPDLVVDVGVLVERKPSTIVRVEGGRVGVLREGSLRIRGIV